MNSEVLILDTIVDKFFPETDNAYKKLSEEDKMVFVRALNDLNSLEKRYNETNDNKEKTNIEKEIDIVLGGLNAIKGLGSNKRNKQLVRLGAKIASTALQMAANHYLSEANINSQINKLKKNKQDINFLAYGIKAIDLGSDIYKILKEE